MQIKEVQIDNNVTITVSGRIDIETSQILEASIEKWLPSPAINKIILNLSAVEYISSAGIRVLLSAQKQLSNNHELIIKTPSMVCKQVFDITGADIFLKIEY